MIPKGEILDLCSISTSYLHGVSLLLLLRTDSDGDDWQKQLGKCISPWRIAGPKRYYLFFFLTTGVDLLQVLIRFSECYLLPNEKITLPETNSKCTSEKWMVDPLGEWYIFRCKFVTVLLPQRLSPGSLWITWHWKTQPTIFEDVSPRKNVFFPLSC